LGVTPSAWSGGYVGFQVKDAAFASFSSGFTWVGNNWFNNSGNKYIANGTATLYQQNAGAHSWHNAPSGTAGNAITFTQAMTLDASGRLGIGTTSPSAVLSLVSSNQPFHLYTGSTLGFSWGQFNSSGDASINNGANANLLFATNNTERARIDSSGNMLVGTTSSVPFFGTTAGSVVTPTYVGCSRSGGPALYVNRYTSTGTAVDFRYAGSSVGAIDVTAIATTYNSLSDYRLKTVVGPVADAGQRIDALQPVEYTWKADGSRTRGFLAHQFQEVYAGSVTGTKDAVDEEGKPVYQSMQAGSAEVIADLVAEIQSLRARVAQLESN
jgi:hypothetical protein